MENSIVISTEWKNRGEEREWVGAGEREGFREEVAYTCLTSTTFLYYAKQSVLIFCPKTTSNIKIFNA